MRHSQPTQTLPRSSASTLDDARWAAFAARDPACDGLFFASVTTTGIYCRPSCPARRAKREHVRFYETAADAEAAGFRPCKRCKPNQPSLLQQHAGKVAEACRLIETAEEEPKLDALARSAGLSPYHFHRIFKAMLGMTPKAYAAAQRNKRVREELSRSTTVTEAIYGAGFNSNGRYGQGGLIRERFRNRIIEADPNSLLDDEGSNLDPHRIWAAMMSNVPGYEEAPCLLRPMVTRATR